MVLQPSTDGPWCGVNKYFKPNGSCTVHVSLYCTEYKTISDVKVEIEWRAIFRVNGHHLDIKHIVFLTSKVYSSASKNIP